MNERFNQYPLARLRRIQAIMEADSLTRLQMSKPEVQVDKPTGGKVCVPREVIMVADYLTEHGMRNLHSVSQTRVLDAATEVLKDVPAKGPQAATANPPVERVPAPEIKSAAKAAKPEPPARKQAAPSPKIKFTLPLKAAKKPAEPAPKVAAPPKPAPKTVAPTKGYANAPTVQLPPGSDNEKYKKPFVMSLGCFSMSVSLLRLIEVTDNLPGCEERRKAATWLAEQYDQLKYAVQEPATEPATACQSA